MKDLEFSERVRGICDTVRRRLLDVHVSCFAGRAEPLLLISTEYPGVWLEHVYDAVFLATLDRSRLYLAENTVNLFIENQKSDGQLPCLVLDGGRVTGREPVAYSQTQECVSFARLCLLVYRMNGDRTFLERTYRACAAWAGWLRGSRMTTGRGLVEMFVGFDTGHDRSGRLTGLSCPGNYTVDGVRQPASLLPPGEETAPVVAVDMSCNFYATLTALSEMGSELGLNEESDLWRAQAAEVKRRLFEVCFDADDCYFYDVDRHGRRRKYLSSTVFHLFMEGVLDKDADEKLIREIYERHISNPREFATPFPYPSMAVSDPSCVGHEESNCWGYYSQGLIALRSTLWMEKYGFTAELENLCERWVEAWTEHFDEVRMGQELDPITGVPTKCSEWYSSTMLFYLYAARRIGIDT